MKSRISENFRNSQERLGAIFGRKALNGTVKIRLGEKRNRHSLHIDKFNSMIGSFEHTISPSGHQCSSIDHKI
ncbi:hypothetical protein BpHYR1_052657 [Brachionus plicatilis]|uniref:Uncharacterized protein n=1 Tax=Brachionus plicatilis TaxID=10195 RepID=A0A3M7QES7_BRAPC|nr:hypothetical protein BpHYR1_052657 [Brachionus plicatilis]